jgi:hypothetical protein
VAGEASEAGPRTGHRVYFDAVNSVVNSPGCPSVRSSNDVRDTDPVSVSFPFEGDGRVDVLEFDDRAPPIPVRSAGRLFIEVVAGRGVLKTVTTGSCCCGVTRASSVAIPIVIYWNLSDVNPYSPCVVHAPEPQSNDPGSPTPTRLLLSGVFRDY